MLVNIPKCITFNCECSTHVISSAFYLLVVYWTIILVKSKAVPLYAMRVLGWRGGVSYSFLTLALDGESGQHYTPAALYPGEMIRGTHCTGHGVLKERSFNTATDWTLLSSPTSDTKPTELPQLMSVAYNIYHQMVSLLMNWKGYGWKWLSPSF
jgi:hypothetical protein